jgi:hypothetical protein
MNANLNASETPVPAKESDALTDKLRRLMARYPKWLIAGWTIAIVAFLAVLPTIYFGWYALPGKLFTWSNEIWWRWVFTWIGFVFLYLAPVYVLMGAIAVANFVTDASLSKEEMAVRFAQQAVRETEDEVLSRLEEKDDAGLLPLLKYSRAQLDAYYRVGLSQTRRSFFNSVLAMWLGFVLLLAGMALYVAPVEQLGFKPPTQDFHVIVMGGAAIIEFISALFLWVYRSSTAQLTYFYNRQMHTHTAILCFRIASTMQPEKADDTKRAIVDKVLDWSTSPEKTPLPGSKGMRAIIGSGGALKP